MKYRNKRIHAIARINRSKQHRLLLSQQRRLFCIYHGIQKMTPPVPLIYLHAYMTFIPTEITSVRSYGRSSTAYAVCPGCGTAMEREYQKHCDSCGQALLWNSFSKGNIKYKVSVPYKTIHTRDTEPMRGISLHANNKSPQIHKPDLYSYI